jgi:FkbM family methyltransferase
MSNHLQLNRDPKTGMFWPPNDRNAQAWVVGDSEDIPELVRIVRMHKPYVPGRSLMVEAGGHVGWWTMLFKKHFDVIYTFEPNPINFMCLSVNTMDSRIVKFHAALGYERKLIHTQMMEHENSGSCVITESAEAYIPTLRLDDLALPVLDYLQLDVEGFESESLKGAAETLDRCSPVVSIELRGHGNDPKAIAVLTDHGYRQIATVRYDGIFVKGN